MNLPIPVANAQRIEIVCNGLPLWHGAQLLLIPLVLAPSLAPASRGQALTLNPASLVSLQHGASGAKPTSSSHARRAAAYSGFRSRDRRPLGP